MLTLLGGKLLGWILIIMSFLTLIVFLAMFITLTGRHDNEKVSLTKSLSHDAVLQWTKNMSWLSFIMLVGSIGFTTSLTLEFGFLVLFGFSGILISIIYGTYRMNQDLLEKERMKKMSEEAKEENQPKP